MTRNSLNPGCHSRGNLVSVEQIEQKIPLYRCVWVAHGKLAERNVRDLFSAAVSARKRERERERRPMTSNARPGSL